VVATIGRKGADDKLIGLLANGHTVVYAAKEAGVSERTAFRRLQDPVFRRRVQDIRREALERATAMLGTAASSAVGTLVKLLDGESEMARLGAARSILEFGCKLRESLSLEQRLAELEERLAESDPGQRRGGVA
jgi:hypothetical protein